MVVVVAAVFAILSEYDICDWRARLQMPTGNNLALRCTEPVFFVLLQPTVISTTYLDADALSVKLYPCTLVHYW